LIEGELGEDRRSRWRKAILENTAPFVQDATDRLGFPWYQSPYTGTSPNHYSQWAELLYLAGRVFDNPEWTKLGGQILHRFAAVDEAPDG
jgi:hypothetical protein